MDVSEEESDGHDDDPYVEEDFPKEFKMIKFSKWAVIQFFCMILIIAALDCSRFVNIFYKSKLRGLELWKWSLLFLSLLCRRLVAGWVIRVWCFLLSLIVCCADVYTYFVYGLRHAVRNFIWLALILIS